MRILLHNLSKYSKSTRLTFFTYCSDEILSSIKGQTDKNLVSSKLLLLIVINVSLEFFVGRHHLGALLDVHLT